MGWAMAIPQRTYSFRAPPDLGARIAAALAELRAAPGSGVGPLTDAVTPTFELHIHRALAGQPELILDQSAFIRAAVEGLTGAVESAAAEASDEQEYQAWVADDEDGEATRRAALEREARRWANP